MADAPKTYLMTSLMFSPFYRVSISFISVAPDIPLISPSSVFMTQDLQSMPVLRRSHSALRVLSLFHMGKSEVDN